MGGEVSTAMPIGTERRVCYGQLDELEVSFSIKAKTSLETPGRAVFRPSLVTTTRLGKASRTCLSCRILARPAPIPVNGTAQIIEVGR